MIHTVYLDDTTINGRKMLRELRRYRKGVRFDNQAENNTAPESYMTAEEFRNKAMLKVNRFCEEHGIL